MKKESQKTLLLKLAESSFSSDLFLSSKNLCRSKMTAKEKLKMDLMREKHGLEIDKNSQLYVERKEMTMEEFDSENDENDSEMGADLLNENNEHDSVTESSNATLENPVTRAFLMDPNATKSPQVFVADGFSETKLSHIEPPPSQSFGSALKRKDAVVSVVSKSKKKKPTLPKLHENSSSDEEEDALWQSNVVLGEAANMIKPIAKPIPVKAEPIPVTPKVIDPSQKAYHVPVNRPQDIQIARINLPVVGEEQPIWKVLPQLILSRHVK